MTHFKTISCSTTTKYFFSDEDNDVYYISLGLDNYHRRYTYNYAYKLWDSKIANINLTAFLSKDIQIDTDVNIVIIENINEFLLIINDILTAHNKKYKRLQKIKNL